ncbi:Pimeloyl-ACP methyl ester carboxylesterase [Amycolatopsis tolypomycina]|uniref:Pimeloyl-ACP methyl ester carboxylesterase n=1 Tax=Amycolatopsis tolypomycina TaxID=208445 RepID=A0A1H4WU79_9PSEU|nr:alpha/beta hydrolase [Amycolatopsis tolypomycina]SEC96869.1 Pimeloyl-ACP methyl ester carboxylesterase [Amycolatopsis tolypomycina]
MVTETDLVLPGGRSLHVYDTGGPGRPAVFWHHGTPNTGAPPEPLLPLAAELGVRFVSFDRPGYRTSTAVPGRTVGDVAGCVASVADALGIPAFALLGHSGGGSHALATAALLPDRVLAVASLAAVAPVDADGLGWFDGMAAASAASLRAATEGRAVKEKYEATAEFDPDVFTAADTAALGGSWSWLNDVVRAALADGPGGLIDDDLAYVTPWGVDPARITAPALLVHGEQDRMVPAAHSAWLAGRCPHAEYRPSPGDGHLSVLRHAADALTWLADQGSRTSEATTGAR